jgi:thymidine kinase
MMRLVPTRSGWLEVVCGPMFSGKSEELVRRIRQAELAGERCVLCKPALDVRYSAVDVVTHDGQRRTALAVHDGADVLAAARDAEVVGIDEAQFLAPDVVPAVERLVAGGARVIVAGLDRDYRGEPFEPLPELLARADLVDKLQAVCQVCGGAATMTQRLVDGAPAPLDGATVLVGGSERYEARCRHCFERGPVHPPGTDDRAGPSRERDAAAR